MRVLLVSHSPHLCGGEKMLAMAAIGLRRLGFSPLMVIPGDGPMIEYCQRHAIPYATLTHPMPWHIFMPDTVQGLSKLLADSAPVAEELSAIIKNHGSECIVANTLTFIAAHLSAARLCLPLVQWTHGVLDSGLYPSATSPGKFELDKCLVRAADSCWAPSQWTINYFESTFGRTPRLIPNFTFIPEESNDLIQVPNPPVFVNLNTQEEHKGISAVVEAARILASEGRKFELRMFGTGPLNSHLREMSKSGPLNGVLRVMERTADVSSIYKSATALVTGSSIESFGMTLIEAMAHQRLVIVSDTSGHKEIISHPGKYAFACGVGDAAAFSERMRWVIENPLEAMSMGKVGRTVAMREYDGRRSVGMMADDLRRICHKRNSERSSDAMDVFRLLSSCSRNPFQVTTPITIPLGGDFAPAIGAIPPQSHEEPSRTVESTSGQIRVDSIPEYVPNGLFPVTTRNALVRWTASAQNISAVYVYVGTHGRAIEGAFSLKITSVKTRQVLRSVTVDAKKVPDNHRVDFDFEPIKNSHLEQLEFRFCAVTSGQVSWYASRRVANPSRLARLAIRLFSQNHAYPVMIARFNGTNYSWISNEERTE